MKPILFLTALFSFSVAFTQTADKNSIYKKMRQYYEANLNEPILVENIHRNALGYDTSKSNHFYRRLPLYGKDGLAYMWVNNDSLKNGICITDDYYALNVDKKRELKIKRRELKITAFSDLKYIPHENLESLEKNFGFISQVNQKGNILIATTSKYILHIDAITYQLKKLIWVVLYKGRTQYNEYNYSDSSTASLASLSNQLKIIINEVPSYSTTTFKEIEKSKPDIHRFEQTKFSFYDLPSFNFGTFDSAKLSGKYIILDFFYLECLPCHKMTKWIIDWIPSVDSNKIVLLGINPFNAKLEMEQFAKDKRLNYPIVIEEKAKEIRRYYRVNTYPTLFLIAPNGTIVDINEGMSKGFLHKAEKIIRSYKP